MKYCMLVITVTKVHAWCCLSAISLNKFVAFGFRCEISWCDVFLFFFLFVQAHPITPSEALFYVGYSNLCSALDKFRKRQSFSAFK